MDEAGGKFASHGLLPIVTMVLASPWRNADPSVSNKEQIFRICFLSWLKQVMRLGPKVQHVLGLRPYQQGGLGPVLCCPEILLAPSSALRDFLQWKCNPCWALVLIQDCLGVEESQAFLCWTRLLWPQVCGELPVRDGGWGLVSINQSSGQTSSLKLDSGLVPLAFTSRCPGLQV